MSQIALPLERGAASGPARIVLGVGNAHVAEALAAPENWPFRTAVLTGPPCSGKSLFARWFEASGKGDALDDEQLTHAFDYCLTADARERAEQCAVAARTQLGDVKATVLDFLQAPISLEKV